MDGTVFAVRLRPGVARLSRDDLRHEYRDLGAAIAARQTAWALLDGKVRGKIRESLKPQDSEDWYRVLRDWAVNPSVSDGNHPFVSDPRNPGPTLGSVILALGELRELSGKALSERVSSVAAALCGALDDAHSIDYWRKVIWKACKQERLRSTGVQALQAALERLRIDMVEWPDLRSPAALFAARHGSVWV